jgi:DNA-directed RNA polymerase specialized sigma24 family protein
MLRDKDMAKDVVHDLFANLMGNMDRLSINVPISAYLYRAVSNQVIKQYHKDGLERAR